MTDEQNARPDALRALAGDLYYAGLAGALQGLMIDVNSEAFLAGRRGEREYRAALKAEAVIVADTLRQLRDEREAVAHG